MTTIKERHPELFLPINYESPRGKTRTIPLQALCLGFNRTGTASEFPLLLNLTALTNDKAMSAALEQLGLPCWHSFHLLKANFGDNEMWQEAIDRKFFGKGEPFGRREFDELLYSFGAVSSDTPAIAFADDLIAAYPEAKVILVERDIDEWYESYMHAIIGNMFSPFATIVYYLDRAYIHKIGKVHKSVVAGWGGIRSRKDAEAKARDNYRKHYTMVRRLTPPDRLLEFKLEQGWEPLCEFLGKDVPDTEFPRLNDGAWFDEKASILLQQGMKDGLVKAVPWLVVIFGACYWYLSKD